MKLTPELARELIQNGVKVDTTKIVRNKNESIQIQQKEIKPTTPDSNIAGLSGVILDIVELTRTSETNIERLTTLSGIVTKILAEIAKPKPSKEHISTIHRDQRGNISRVITVTKEV